MATRILAGDMEVIGGNDTLVVSPLNTSVSVVLQPIVDTVSHGYRRGMMIYDGALVADGVLTGHALTIRADGAGNINVLDSHHLWIAIVDSGTSKTFTAEGNEPGNRWNITAP